jgi:hypothetical protein
MGETGPLRRMARRSSSRLEPFGQLEEDATEFEEAQAVQALGEC